MTTGSRLLAQLPAMPLTTGDACLALLTIGLTTRAVLRYLRNRRRLPLPPGPPRWPIVDNLFQIPIHNRSQVFHLWSTKYSKLISLVSILTDTDKTLRSSPALPRVRRCIFLSCRAFDLGH